MKYLAAISALPIRLIVTQSNDPEVLFTLSLSKHGRVLDAESGVP